jgi:hypothetical protein
LISESACNHALFAALALRLAQMQATVHAAVDSIAQIACHNNELPQGSPCSPVISNLIAHVLDIHLNKIARSGRCTYTRYVDDLTFSTNEKEFPTSLAQLKTGSQDVWVAGDSLVRYVYRSGFKLNHDKAKQQSPEWQAAAEALLMAAEDRGPLMHAHVGMMLALHGAKPIPEYDSSKEKHWGRRKLKRDE